MYFSRHDLAARGVEDQEEGVVPVGQLALLTSGRQFCVGLGEEWIGE